MPPNNTTVDNNTTESSHRSPALGQGFQAITRASMTQPNTPARQTKPVDKRNMPKHRMTIMAPGTKPPTRLTKG